MKLNSISLYFDDLFSQTFLGTVRKNHFTAFCPNDVPSAIQIDFKWMHEDEGPEAEQNSIVVLTMAKWCPLDQCTVLVLGSQFGIKLYDWDGSTLIYYFDFIGKVHNRHLITKNIEFCTLREI